MNAIRPFGNPERHEDFLLDDVYRLVELIPASNYFLGPHVDASEEIEYEGGLVLAGDAGVNFFDTTVESRHDDDAQRALASILYFREHAITDEKMRSYVIPARASTKSNLFELLRGRCMEWQYSFQVEIMKFYLKGVKRTCDEMGGLDFFKSTTTEERRKMWSALFDQDRMAMAAASLGQLASTIPIGHIFSSRHATNLKWQSYVKNTFVWAAEDTYLLMPRDFDISIYTENLVFSSKTSSKSSTECLARSHAVIVWRRTFLAAEQ